MKSTPARKASPHSSEGWTAANGYGALTETKLALKRFVAWMRAYWLLGLLLLVIVAAILLGADFDYEKKYNGYKSLQDSFPWWWWPTLIGLSLMAYAVSRLSAIAGLLFGILMMLTPFLLLFATDFHKVLEAFPWPFWLLYFVGTGSLLFPAGKIGIDEALRRLRKH